MAMKRIARFVAIASTAVTAAALNPLGALTDLLSGKRQFAPPVVMGDEQMMSQKAHGTSATPVQKELRWGCDVGTADRICNYNRHYAEHAGYWLEIDFLNFKN